MAIVLESGRAAGSVGSKGFSEIVAGGAILPQDVNGNLSDLAAPAMYRELPGVMTGGAVTAGTGLSVVIPAGTRWFARQVWLVDANHTHAVPASAITYVWGCSDGVLRNSSDINTPPVGWGRREATRITKVTTSATAITAVDNTASTIQEKTRYADPIARTLAHTEAHAAQHAAGGSDALPANAISEAMIAANAVTTGKIADDAVDAAKLRDDATTDANRAVTTNHIRDLAVTEAKVATGAVTTGKIADDAVTSAKLQDDAATDANRAVTTNHIRDAAITSAKIGTGAVQTANIGNAQVTLEKLSVDVATQAELDAHVAAPDPHPAYALESALGTASTRNTGTAAGELPLLGTGGRFGEGILPVSVPTWIKASRTFANLAVAAAANDIEIYSLPAGGIVHAVKIKHSAAFTGGTLTAYTASVGVPGNLTKYSGAFNVFQPPGNTVFQLTNTVGSENHGAATSLRLAVVATGANLDAATAGAVKCGY